MGEHEVLCQQDILPPWIPFCLKISACHLERTRERSELSSRVSFILVIKFPGDLLCLGLDSTIRISTYGNITGLYSWFPVSPLCSPRPSLHPPAFSFGFPAQESASGASIPFPFTKVLSSIQLHTVTLVWVTAPSSCLPSLGWQQFPTAANLGQLRSPFVLLCTLPTPL